MENNIKLKQIPDFPDYYTSEHGEVFSMRVNSGKYKSKRQIDSTPRKLKQYLNKQNGYLYVGIYGDGKQYVFSVHRLTASSFYGAIPKHLQVLHNDGNRLNNNISNLRFGTIAENCRDTVLHGHSTAKEKHPNVKLTQIQVDEIRSLNNVSGAELARRYGVCDATICLIRKRKRWT